MLIGATRVAGFLLTGVATVSVTHLAVASDWGQVDVSASPMSAGGQSVTIEVKHTGIEPADQTGTVERQDTARSCTYQGDAVTCRSKFGTWSQAKECWIQVATPQPPGDHVVWENRLEGTLFWCTPPASRWAPDPTAIRYLFWAPDGEAVDLVDPVVLAERAVEQMRLTAPRIGLTPLEPGAPLLVGVDMWLWIENADERGFGPITRTATAGPSSVTASARVTKVVWDMGDGNDVTCKGAGTPWSPSKGTGPSPTCGYRYASPSSVEPGGSFEVRATAHWLVDWSGAGQSGTIRFTLRGSRDVPVTELQVLHVS